MARAAAAEKLGFSGSKTRLNIADSLVLAWTCCMGIPFIGSAFQGEYSTAVNSQETGKMQGTALHH